MERKKQRISDLFYDNRFLLAFSVLFALIAWLIVATEFSETQNTIRNIKVQINYSNINNSGLQPFVEKDYFVDVTIKGKRYIVESDDIEKDIIAVADTSFINSAGDFPLDITVTSKSVRPEYEFVSVSPQTIENITFDYRKDGEFKIEPEIKFISKSGKAVRDGFFMDEPIISDVISKVNVSGPETALKNVVRVVAEATIDEELDKTTPVDAVLKAVDKDGKQVQGVTFDQKLSVVKVQIPVYYVAELPITCSFDNVPTEYIGNIPFDYTVSPAKAKFKIYDENFDRESIELSRKIDFSELYTEKNSIPVDVSENDFSGAVLLDKDITRFVVTVNVPGVSQKSFIISPENINIRNLPENVEVEFLNFKFKELTVKGYADKLELLNNENIVVIADFDGIDESELKDTVSVPLSLYDGYCWSVGEYFADYIVK